VYLTPWIQEIKLPSRFADIPPRSFFPDELGHIFLGKDNGLTVIDGERSFHISMDGPVYVTGKKGSDTLFYTCKNDLGYITGDRRGGLRIKSLKHRIPPASRSFLPEQLVLFENGYFINTDRGVYYLGPDTLQHFIFPAPVRRMHRVERQLYLSVEGRGISRWNGSSFEEFVKLDRSEDERLWLLGREGNGLLALSPNGTLRLLSTDQKAPPVTDHLPFLEGITFLEQINDRLVLVSTREHGIGIFDNRGHMITLFENKGGLPEQDIQQIYADGDNEIWILASRSLHKITYPSPAASLQLNTAETGIIQAVVMTDKGFALGTSRGVFTIEQDADNGNLWNVQDLHPGAGESVHLLASCGNLLIAGGARNLTCIGDGHAECLDQGAFTGLISLDEDAFVAAGDRGIELYRLRENKWDIRQIDPSLISAHSFVRFEEGIFFLCAEKVYMLSDDPESTISLPVQPEEMPYRLIALEGKLYLQGNSRLYAYDGESRVFKPAPEDPAAGILSTADILFPIGPGQYLVVQNESRYRSRILNIRNIRESSEMEMVFPVLQQLGEIVGLHMKDSVVYLTGKDRIALFDLREIGHHQEEVSVRIDRIWSDDTGLVDMEFTGSSKGRQGPGDMVLSHSSNELEIHLAGLEHQSYPDPLFRYRLHPGHKEWSAWNGRRDISLRNLHHGQYRFLAQSKDLFGNISEPVALHFTVRAPFYQTWYAYVIYVLLCLFGLFLLRKWRLLSYQRAAPGVSAPVYTRPWETGSEKEGSAFTETGRQPDTVTEQQSKGRGRWDKYDRATVLFSDIQGFTRIAEEMNPELLIDELDKFFFHFDSVVDKYNIEKIKTIGDAYMAAGGIPEKNSTNPVEVVLAALEMQTYMQQLKSTRARIWDLRIGIHTGPVIAGVIGHKKVSYDIWGDTVNTASRMESSGMPGKVNISGITYELVKDYFICEYRGKLPVKYKGNIDMYFVTGLRPELSVDLKGIPNKRFYVKLQLLRLGDLEERVFDQILAEFPESLHFHTPEYARRVYDQSFLLCRSEELDQEERLLVRTAALMVFTGLTQSYTNFENRSSVISREILPLYKYSETQIDQICNLILSTKAPFDPHNKLEMILIDARMEYVGRPDYRKLINDLYREATESGRQVTWEEFTKEQLELLSGFCFFTLAGQRLREIPAAEQMAKLEREG